jgi:hypothetical protein
LVQLDKINPPAAMNKPAAKNSLVIFFISDWFWLMVSLVDINFMQINWETNIP